MSRLASVAAACVLLALTIIFFTPVFPGGVTGLCLPSPNQWAIPYPFGGISGAILILLCAALVSYSNKRYNFIPGPRSAAPSLLLLLVATNCLTTSFLSTSTLLLTVNCLCLYVILSTYEARNATREFFIIASLLAIGSMVQYAFVVYIPAYIFGGIALKSFRTKEFFAFILGLAAPYWIAIGLGLVSPLALRLPDRLGVIDTGAVDPDVFYTLIAAGAMAILGIIVALYTGVLLFSRNSRLRCMHITFNIIGFVSVVALIFDFENFPAYYATIALWLAIETAALTYFSHYRHPRLLTAILLLLFLPPYILALIN